MGYVILHDTIEIDPVSLKKYNQNIHILHSLSISLNNVMEDSKHYVSQVEAFMASSFTLSNDLHKIGLQFNDIAIISSSIAQLNREINQLLPSSLRDCKLILDFSLENQVFFDHTENFKNIKQEIDKYLQDSITYRRELKLNLLRYQKTPSESNSDKIASTMAKLNQSINFYDKYLSLLEHELSEFCGTRHKYLLDLSKNIFNLHHLIHFGRKVSDESLTSSINIKHLTPQSNHPVPLKQKIPTTLKDIVNNPIFLKSLRIFSEKQHCLENLLFWLDAMSLKELEATSFPKDRLKSLFINMCNYYVEPDCPYEINIDSDSKKALEHRKATLDSNEPFYPAFAQAVDSVYSLLNFSMLPLFFKSPIYNAALMMSRSYSEESLDIKGISHVLCSLDTILRNPISFEYFLLFIKSTNTSPMSSTPSTPTSLSPSPSFNTLSSAGSSVNINLVPPLALSFSPKLSPLVPTFSPQLVTNQDIENMLYFYLDINKFKDINNDEELENLATELFDIYLKPTSEKRIVSISTISILEAINSKNITKDLFQGVSQDIILHIANVYFPAFLTSQACKDMLLREEKMKKYQEKEDKKKLESKIELQFDLISREKLKTILPNKIKSLLSNYNIINNNSNQNQNQLVNNGNISSTFNLGNITNKNDNNNINNNNNNINNNNNNNNNINNNNSNNINASQTFVQYAPQRTPSPNNSGFSSASIVLLDNSNNNTNVEKFKRTSPSYPNSSPSLSNTASSTNSNILSSVSSPQLGSFHSSGINHPNSMNSSSSSTPTTPTNFSFSATLFNTNNNSENDEESNSNETFLYVLTDPVWLDGFKKFVWSEKSEEVILCWMELESFFKNPQVNRVHATTIYDTFFKESSPLEVCITDMELRNQMKQSLTSSSDEQLQKVFKTATEEIIDAMRTDAFSRFVKSQLYKDLSKEHGCPSDSKNRKGFYLNRKKKLNNSSNKI